MTPRRARIIAVGDVQPYRDDPKTLFQRVIPELEWGDLRYCQLECTISDKGVVRTDVRNPAHRVPPENLEALTSAGFNVVSYAGNNNLDYGIEAFDDTLQRLRSNGIDYVGAGSNLEDARRPLYTDVNGIRIAWLNFCSILRDGFEATPQRPGISPLKIKTFYEPLENIYEQPGTPCRTITLPDPNDLDLAMAAIREAKDQAEIVIGCFHWGVHFTYDLALYQPEIAYAAIDNGCDLVLGTHPHCLQAIDVYKGKFIFYSLGNFAFEQPEARARRGVSEYLSFYGIPAGRHPTHPHPEHCRMTIIVRIEITDGDVSVSVLPAYFSDDSHPEIQEAGSPMHTQIVSLLREISAELGTALDLKDGRLHILPEKRTEIDTRVLLRGRKNSYPWAVRLSAITGTPDA